MNNILLALLHGIILGGIYAMIAIGLSVIFGVTKVVNFAHGSVLMTAAYAFFVLFSKFNIDPFIAIIVVAPLWFVFGYLIQRFLIKPLLVRERADVVSPNSVMLFTIGLNYTLMNLFLMIFTSQFRTLTTWAYKNYLRLFNGTFVSQYARIISFGVACVLAFVLWFIINKTELGKKIRSVSMNRDAAAICGVDVHSTYGIAFGLGTAATAIAAACVSEFYIISPNLGNTFGTKSFMIVVLGGLGSIPGAIVGGLVFGIIEQVGAQFVTSTMATMLSFAAFLIVLLLKPNGLLGKKGR